MSDILTRLPDKFVQDIAKAIEILKKAGCTEIYIFGSLATGKFNEQSDIDIAVKGLASNIFFKVYAELMMNLESGIDLIDLDEEDNRFAQFIQRKGEMIKVA